MGNRYELNTHEHTPQCFELPETDFYYVTAAKLMHELNGTLLPTTNLREFRRINLQRTQARKIAEMAPSTDESDAAEVSDSTSITAPTIATHLPSTSTSSIPASLDTTATPAESANAIDIRACMAAFAAEYSNAAGVAKHTEILVDLGMPVSDWGGIEKPDLEDMDICWAVRDLVRWKSFAKKWAVWHVFEPIKSVT